MKRRWVVVLGLLAILSLAAEFSISLDLGHGHWWHRIPGFFIYFGFIGCVLLIVFSKKLGKFLLLKDEDYYDDK